MKIEHTEEDIKIKISKLLKADIKNFKNFHIRKKSIDARDKRDIRYVYSVSLNTANEDRYIKLPNVTRIAQDNFNSPFAAGKTKPAENGCVSAFEASAKAKPALKHRPVIAGSGPAGLFCALELSKAGCAPIVLERGADADTRLKDISNFLSAGLFNENSNVLFGEGGAGTFSDGKLTCATNDKRIPYILQTFAAFGAPPEILYESKPHIGTDYLAKTVKNMRGEIERSGGEVRFFNRLDRIETVVLPSKQTAVSGVWVKNANSEYFLETDAVVLAIGHSARDTLQMLHDTGISMKPKSFSVGMRFEHKREFINQLQYGRFHKQLPAADYKLAVKLSNGRGAYTFCMCPGGFVVPSVSEAGYLAVNGMSRYLRSAENSNSAVLISVTPDDFGGNSPLSGIAFQREFEKAAFKAGGGNYFAPAQKFGDFLNKVKTESFGGVTPSFKPGVTPVNMYDFFNEKFLDNIGEAILKMDEKLRGFAQNDAVLTGIETRSSSPVSVLRGDNLCSNILGVYPCGEGCGHAGGIVSSAADGIKCAEAILSII
jgi:uncharacterized FAD-dependent dehydrogenase